MVSPFNLVAIFRKYFFTSMHFIERILAMSCSTAVSARTICMSELLDSLIPNMYLEDEITKKSTNVNGHECNFVRYLLK